MIIILRCSINPGEYWAKNYILFAQELGYVLSNAEPIAENWDVPATREQVVYAVTKAYDRSLVYKNVESSNISDWNDIDPSMRETILRAYNQNIIDSNGDGTFKPRSNITKAEMCQILYSIPWTSKRPAVVAASF